MAWITVGLVPLVGGPGGHVLLFAALAAEGLAGGVENANEMSSRQRAVPDELLGRVNATGRSVNRTAGAVGAVAGGILTSAVGVTPSIWIVAALFAVAAILAMFPPLRSARA